MEIDKRSREALSSLREFVSRNPLAAATLWHRDKPHTSQREAARRVLAPRLFVGLILGGNRSGKSEVGAMLSICYALGSNDASVRIFLKRNGLEEELGSIPPEPGLVCCSALTGNDSIRVQREKIAAYLPAGTRWTNRYGHGEATARLPGGGCLIFKSNDQRQRSYQGASWSFLWTDEEHDEPVFNEARMRLADRAGRCVQTMTPLKGRSWVWRRFLHEPEPGSAHYSLSSRDNPHIPQDYLDALLRRYGPHERAARERGEFTALEGRVYEFSRHLHVIPRRPIGDSPIYVGIDFGVRNPFAGVFCTIEGDDILVVWDLIYKSDTTISRHAESIRRILGDRQPEWIVADPEDKASRLALARDHGIPNVPAKKGPGSVRHGISTLAGRLEPDPEGRVHLLVMEHCRELIEEFEGYCWATHTGHGEPVDRPANNSQDHALDALRYTVSRLARSGFAVG